MAWRGIHLSRSSYLSLEHQSLKLEFRDGEGGTFRIPLEDLSYLIIDTAEVSLSGRILSALADSSVMVLGSDTKHQPAWAALPWTRFYKQGETLNLQLQSTLPQRKQLWTHIVRLKIQAQAHCLAQNKLNGAEKLKAIATQIKSGDPDNTEARAARLYWSLLFPNRQFRRHDDDFPNACLNYAYALLRAALARHLCALGFVTQLGIHHESLSNAYNLADDLIEPYRPIADHFALQVIGSRNSESEFTTDDRRSITQLLEAELHIDEEIYATMAAIELTASSLRHALSGKNPGLIKFPTYFAP